MHGRVVRVSVSREGRKLRMAGILTPLGVGDLVEIPNGNSYTIESINTDSTVSLSDGNDYSMLDIRYPGT